MAKRSDPAAVNLRKLEFLSRLKEGGTIKQICEDMGISYSTPYQWKGDDPGFARAMAAADEVGTDHLEDEARRRALAGSDNLLMFLLRAKRPEVYGQKSQVEISGRVTHDHRHLTLDQMRERLLELRRLQGDDVAQITSNVVPLRNQDD